MMGLCETQSMKEDRLKSKSHHQKKGGASKLLKFLVIFCFSFFLSSAPLWAQNQGQQSTGAKYGPKKQVATIIFAGLGGAVLGLSTLSFYGRPQDELANIAIGAGVGIIIGTIYVTYRAATTPDEFYGPQSYKKIPENPHQVNKNTYPTVGYNWSF